MKLREKREMPEKAYPPAASPGTIPTCEYPGVARPWIESGSPCWEASSLTAKPLRPRTEYPSLQKRNYCEHAELRPHALATCSKSVPGDELSFLRVQFVAILMGLLEILSPIIGVLQFSSALIIGFQWSGNPAKTDANPQFSKCRIFASLLGDWDGDLVGRTLEGHFIPTADVSEANRIDNVSPGDTSIRVFSPVSIFSLLYIESRGGVVVRLLASHQCESGSIPGSVTLRIFACGNHACRCHWSVSFLGDLPFPSPLHSGSAPYLHRFTLCGVSVRRLGLVPGRTIKDLEAEERQQQFPLDYDHILDVGNPSPSIRDQEYLQHSSLWGHQYMTAESPPMSPAEPTLADQQARPADVRCETRQKHPCRSEDKPYQTANIFSTSYCTIGLAFVRCAGIAVSK
ncbi:hypothetical protein PR048_023305 [Dryococelus australis]|uniref:Uncharacterized protein n=1 Tax=Dryococelus australis TaxID=614101 RepID=A0ABQ9GTP7_9NEOP|nr:hypothetical protein PR048_023305 [Dryococelus australis]